MRSTRNPNKTSHPNTSTNFRSNPTPSFSCPQPLASSCVLSIRNTELVLNQPTSVNNEISVHSGFLVPTAPSFCEARPPVSEGPVVLVGGCPGESRRIHCRACITSEEVEPAFDNLETRSSHARQSVGRLRSAMQIPRSCHHSDFARPEVSSDRRSSVEDNDPTMHSLADRR